MTDETSHDDKLFEEALDLIIRVQGDPSNPVARELVQRWRARSAEHEAAWAEVAEIHGMAGQVLEDRRKAGGTATRRNVILGGVAGAGILGAGALFVPDLLTRARADHATSTGEVRQVTLADGTLVTLGPDSAIRTEFTPAVRQVELLAGMAFFEVAKGAGRPFLSRVDDLTATALGTAFDLSRDAQVVSVAVDHGLVEVALAGGARLPAERLAPGDWLTLDERTRAIGRGRRAPDQIAAWRDGMIVAERETVASVVARIARWQPGRVVIADPRFGALRISGVFDASVPAMALEAVVQPHGGRVWQISPWLTVISPV
ncbi:MAG: FecR protein [Xanthobacteraceae bacterium]|jgi:transmembrane sensor|nr:FecR protein [Xanthobacteraceae bacterium]